MFMARYIYVLFYPHSFRGISFSLFISIIISPYLLPPSKPTIADPKPRGETVSLNREETIEENLVRLQDPVNLIDCTGKYIHVHGFIHRAFNSAQKMCDDETVKYCIGLAGVLLKLI
jgi:hypothetical protein